MISYLISDLILQLHCCNSWIENAYSSRKSFTVEDFHVSSLKTFPELLQLKFQLQQFKAQFYVSNLQKEALVRPKRSPSDRVCCVLYVGAFIKRFLLLCMSSRIHYVVLLYNYICICIIYYDPQKTLSYICNVLFCSQNKMQFCNIFGIWRERYNDQGIGKVLPQTFEPVLDI